MSMIRVDKITSATGLSAPSFPKGVARAFYPLKLTAPNQIILSGGYLYLDDGRELASWDGTTYGADIQIDLRSEVNNTGVLSTSANTTYYLYIALAFVGGTVQTPGIGRAVHAVQKGASGALIVLGSPPESTSLADYVYIGVLRTDNTTDFTAFEVPAETQATTGGTSSGLQGVYSSGGTIVTNPTNGSVVIGGTEALKVQGAGGLEVTNTIKRGAPGAQLEQQYFDLLTLTDGSTAVLSSLTYDALEFEGVIVDYKVKVNAVGVRVGRLLISNMDTTAISFIDSFSETVDIGLNWNLAVSGGDIELSYTTSMLGEDRIMRADVKRIRA